MQASAGGPQLLPLATTSGSKRSQARPIGTNTAGYFVTESHGVGGGRGHITLLSECNLPEAQSSS